MLTTSSLAKFWGESSRLSSVQPPKHDHPTRLQCRGMRDRIIISLAEHATSFRVIEKSRVALDARSPEQRISECEMCSL